jgi:hypothetical protein
MTAVFADTFYFVASFVVMQREGLTEVLTITSSKPASSPC